MKNIFKRQLLGIPIAIILVFALGIGVLASQWLVRESRLDVSVSEGLSIQWALSDNATIWSPMTTNVDVFEDVIAGESITVYYKIRNLAQRTLTAWLEIDMSDNVTTNATTHTIWDWSGYEMSGGEEVNVSMTYHFPEGLVPAGEDYWTDIWYWRLYVTQ